MIESFEYIGPRGFGRRRWHQRSMARVDDLLQMADDFDASHQATSRVGRRTAQRREHQDKGRPMHSRRHGGGPKKGPASSESPPFSEMSTSVSSSASPIVRLPFPNKRSIQQGRHAKQRLEPSQAALRRERARLGLVEATSEASEEGEESDEEEAKVSPPERGDRPAARDDDKASKVEGLARVESHWGWMSKQTDARWGSGRGNPHLCDKLVRKYKDKRRTECKISCQDERAEEKLEGLARPLRKGILMSPWEWRMHKENKESRPMKHTMQLLKSFRRVPKSPQVPSTWVRHLSARARQQAALRAAREERYRREREERVRLARHARDVVPQRAEEARTDVRRTMASVSEAQERREREKEERRLREEELKREEERQEQEQREQQELLLQKHQELQLLQQQLLQGGQASQPSKESHDDEDKEKEKEVQASGSSTEEHSEHSADKKKGQKGWAVPPKASSTTWPAPQALDWTEEDTAELSKMAGEEAAKCVAADGTLRLARLRMLLRTSQPRLLKQVLGRFPPSVLQDLASHASELTVPKEFLEAFLTGDVVNSALIAEQNRCRLAWMKRPAPQNDDCEVDGQGFVPPPPPIGQPLSSTKICILGDYRDKVKIVKRQLDLDEEQHPRTEAFQQDGLPISVDRLAMFRVLLACFTHGVSEDLPFHKGIVVGGSACYAALNVLKGPYERHRATLEEFATLFECTGTTTKTLVDALGRRGGARNVATRIMSFLKLSQEDIVKRLDPIASELYGQNSFYHSADLDLFIVADSKAGATAALEETFQIVHSAMRHRFDLAKTRCHVSDSSSASASSTAAAVGNDPVIVRTPNSITLCGAAPLRNTQLVCKLAEDVNEMLSFADLPCTALAYDGKRLWATKMAHLSLSLGYNLMSNTQLMGRAADLCQRIAKYCLRGCGVMVYELCRHEPRCDVRISSDIRKRLDRIAHFTACGSRAGGRTGYRARNTGEEDYDTVDLPRAGKRTLRDFLASLATKDDANFEEVSLETKVAEGEKFWMQKLEWRREKLPQVRRKFGLDAEDRRCYMCSVDIPNASRPKKEEDAPSQRRILCCTKCSAINLARTEDREDLTGYTAVVTGGRCKIGYEACLTLLRAGAFVVTSTRFPRCAARRFAAEKDAQDWIQRLHIYGVDFSDFPSLRALAEQLVTHYPVDILINNAAQTIRRPPAYYSTLFSEELDIFEYGLKVGENTINPVRTLDTDPWKDVPTAEGAPTGSASKALALVVAAGSNPMAVPPALRSAAAAIMPRDESEREELANIEARKFFPGDRTDMHGEQLDLRPSTTWSQTLATAALSGGISHRELLEVLAVNAAAPFILVQALLPALTNRETRSKQNKTTPDRGRFVVNVTSAEGIFNPDGAASKGAEHPHSNMAKAALNMLTKTIDGELAGLGVYCTAVDPGWVSMMRPGEQNLPNRPLPPLTEADGAARVLAPIFDGLRALRSEPLGSVEPPHGVLLKNFEVIEW